MNKPNLENIARMGASFGSFIFLTAAMGAVYMGYEIINDPRFYTFTKVIATSELAGGCVGDLFLASMLLGYAVNGKK